MGKRDIDRRVADALKALTATKEDSIRDLAEALDKIEAIDSKITALNKTRNELIATADEKNEAAKTAGWKVRELSDPRPRRPASHRGYRRNAGTRDRTVLLERDRVTAHLLGVDSPIPSPLILYATTAESRATKHGFTALRVSHAKSCASSPDTSAPTQKLLPL